jgi:hypothetical protein
MPTTERALLETFSTRNCLQVLGLKFLQHAAGLKILNTKEFPPL